MSVRFGVVRVALLSVDEAFGLVARNTPGDDPLIETAINLAWGSPSDGSSEPAQRPHLTTMRYIARMGGRATPFGVFAGTRQVDVARERGLALAPREAHAAHVRLDFETLRQFVTDALEESDLERWPVRRNRTLRPFHGGLRYMKSGDSTADLVTVKPTPAIETLLGVLGDKTMLVGELLDALESHFPGTNREHLRGFLDTLIARDLLQPAIDLLKPGDEPADLALSLLERIGHTARADRLAALVASACGPRPLDAGLAVRLGTAWTAATRDLPSITETPPNRRYHLDLEVAMDAAEVDERTVDDLHGAVRRMERLFGGPVYLPEFIQAFRRRYEDAEVPLLDALDLENGVLRSGERESSRLAALAGVRGRHQHHDAGVRTDLLKILSGWIGGERSVDVSHLPMAEHSTVRGLLASLLDDHEGRFRSMLAAGHQRTPMALIGRFALGRPELTERMRAWTREELADETGGAAAPIHAELVYSTESRISNVLLRPRLYPDEIALDGGGDGTLPLDRLLIRLDGDRLRLRDVVTGRDVIIEMNTAHNVTAESLSPFYTFLGMLVSPGAVGWSWGPLRRLPHLPRITCGTVIVAPESWTLTGADVTRVLAARDAGQELRRLLPGLGERRWVGVGEDDRVMAMDVESPRTVELALHRLRKDERVEFAELPHVESPATAGPTGRHVTEIAFPVRRTSPRPAVPRPVTPYSMAPGISWVYAKYYCGLSGADMVVGHARALAGELREAGVIGDWFFLRYHDEGFHIRVRMRPSDPGDRTAVLTAMDELGRRLRGTGLTSRTVFDEYVPETARYGGPDSLPQAESLFTADSEAVADLVVTCPAEDVRLFHCVADILHWCTTLFDSLDDRHDFLKKCRDGLGLYYEKGSKRQALFFREYRHRLDAYLADAPPAPQVTERVAALARSVRATAGDRHRLFSVAASALHMHCNRLFNVDARRMEFLAYDLAGRKIREYRARTAHEGRGPS